TCGRADRHAVTTRRSSDLEQAQHAKVMLERTKATGDVVLMTNAENDYKGFKADQDALEIFKKDLGTFTRQYEFMSQIVDYDEKRSEEHTSELQSRENLVCR